MKTIFIMTALLLTHTVAFAANTTPPTFSETGKAAFTKCPLSTASPGLLQQQRVMHPADYQAPATNDFEAAARSTKHLI